MALAAEKRVRDHVRITPVESSQILGERVHFKFENHQRTGSFKVRGAFNRMLLLSEEELARGVVAASTGNHGQAVACAATALGTQATIYAPEHADPAKLAAISRRGASISLHGEDCVVAEEAARRCAAEEGLTYISPYNDPEVVAGQATLGVELARQLQGIDTVFIALGGGGLLGGVGGYLKAVLDRVQVVACSPANSCVMHDSIEAGRVLQQPSEPTLSDGTAGGVEADTITFELCRDVVDHCVLVSEEEIAAAMRMLIQDHHTMVEGAAGVALAGFLSNQERFASGNSVIVLCGANASGDVLRRVLR